MRATCPTPHLNQSYELCPPWEQHLRYVPHRVRNGYNIASQHKFIQKYVLTKFPCCTVLHNLTFNIASINLTCVVCSTAVTTLIWGANPSRDKSFSLLLNVQNGTAGLHVSYSLCTWGSFQGAKWSGQDPNHSYPSSARTYMYTSMHSILNYPMQHKQLLLHRNKP